MPHEVMEAKLATVARSVAVALQDPVLRGVVLEGLHSSQHREHKLHFRQFLRQVGSPLLARVADLERRSPEAVLSALDSVVDLEFYMPVQEHFAAWQGGADLIVVAQINDDDIPVGYTLSGEPVSGLSTKVPPETPSLVLVPVETDFSPVVARAEECPDCGGSGGSGGSGGGTNPSSYTELWAVEMVLEDDGEGWPRGSPELVISTFWRFADGSVQPLHCAHEEQADPLYRWDGSAGWSGEVLVTPLSVFDVPGGSGPLTGVMLWENDNEGSLCVFDPEYPWQYFDGQMQRAQWGGYRADWRRLEQDSNGDGLVDAIITFLVNFGSLLIGEELFGNDDDVVGLVTLNGSASGFEDPKNIVRFLEAGLPSGNGWVRFQLR